MDLGFVLEATKRATEPLLVYLPNFGRQATNTAGIPIGFDDDTAYLVHFFNNSQNNTSAIQTSINVRPSQPPNMPHSFFSSAPPILASSLCGARHS